MLQKFHLRSKNRTTSDIQPAACYLVLGLDSMKNSKKEIGTIYPACDILLHSMTGRDRSPTQHTLQGGREVILSLPPLRRTPFSFFFLKYSFGEHFTTLLLRDQKLLPRSLIRSTNGATYHRSHGFHFRLTPPSPVFCHSQGPINYSDESLGFPWDVCIFLWETAKHWGKAVWAEMTTKLEGMLPESNNHSTRIY